VKIACQAEDGPMTEARSAVASMNVMTTVKVSVCPRIPGETKSLIELGRWNRVCLSGRVKSVA